jgi:hypothetical protein
VRAAVRDRLGWDPLEAPADAVLGPTFQIRFATPAGPAHVIVVGERPDLLEDARERVLRLTRTWSPTNPGSDLAQLARAAGRPVGVSPETLLLLGLAVLGQEQTRGRFQAFPLGSDPVIDGLSATWPGPQHPALATLSTLATGVTADLAAQEAVDAGADGVCVNVAGRVRVTGVPPRPGGWVVEVGGAVVRLVDGGISGAEGAGPDGGSHGVVVSESAWRAHVLAVAAVAEPAEAVALLAHHQAEGVLWPPGGSPRHPVDQTARWPDLALT